jgi:DNA repair protein SbcC/Rad50
MRPVVLRIQAFGSYPGEERVDFSALALHGLFVVAGPTGSGKTTLFDALAYALYGGLPAGRPDDVRSHHADPATPTEVELDFEVDGHRFRVARRPRQPQPKKRGAGFTTLPATAELHQITDAGPRALASGPRDVTARCESLVGLTATQFDRVVLLPQGKFAEFLLSTTNERTPILQQLFGTQLYAAAVESLKAGAAALRSRLDDAEVGERHHVVNAHAAASDLVETLAPTLELEADAGIDAIEQTLVELSPLLARARASALASGKAADAAAEVAARAEAAAAAWDHRAELLVRRADLEADRSDIGQARRSAAMARRADPVHAAVQRERKAIEHRERCRGEAAAARALALSALSAAGLPSLPESANDAMALLGQRREVLRALAGRFDDLLSRRAELELRRQLLAEAESALVEVEGRRCELGETLTAEQLELAALVEVAGELAERRMRATEARALLERRRALVDDDERAAARRRAADAASRRAQELSAQFLAGAAPRLAALLAPGTACPVCGSVEHPRPATAGGVSLVDATMVDRALHEATAAEADAAAAAAAVREHVAALGDHASAGIEELAARCDAATARQQEAEAASAAVDRLRAGIVSLETELGALAEERERLADAARTVGGAVAHAVEAVTALTAELDGVDQASVAAQIARVDAAEGCVKDADRCERALDIATAAAADTGRDLAEALAVSGFGDVDLAEAAWVPGETCDELERAVAAWEQADRDVTTLLAQLASEGLPDDRPDAEAARSRATHQRELASEAAARVVRLDQRFDDAQRAVADGHVAAAGVASLRASYETAARVAATCDGKGPGRIGLETWVLAGELERVSEAANVHLQRMTGGRYRLLRSDTAEHGGRRAGLDLRVHDSHTGRERPPASLSGGEQFQASLALALGLADVVSQGGSGSGRVFEALFVDEGFGSLDAEALDDAIDALHQLRATGRMIGVITHVEAMKQQLPVGIEVRRRPDGVGSTLQMA